MGITYGDLLSAGFVPSFEIVGFNRYPITIPSHIKTEKEALDYVLGQVGKEFRDTVSIIVYWSKSENEKSENEK